MNQPTNLMEMVSAIHKGVSVSNIWVHYIHNCSTLGLSHFMNRTVKEN